MNIERNRKDGSTSLTLRVKKEALRVTLTEFMMMMMMMMIVHSLKIALS